MSTTTAGDDASADRAGGAPARTRNRRGEGGRLRADILAAAAELLDDGREEAVTLRAVARRAGIATPSIYAHFADRQAILLAIVTEAFAELSQQLTAADAGPDSVVRLQAVCAAFLDFAETQPQRYRVMFGGLWSAAAAVEGEAITEAEALSVGQDVLAVLVGSVQACADAGVSTSDNPRADAVALWLGLHGLASQRTAATAFPWPEDIVERLVVPLARLVPSSVGSRS